MSFTFILTVGGRKYERKNEGEKKVRKRKNEGEKKVRKRKNEGERKKYERKKRQFSEPKLESGRTGS